MQNAPLVQRPSVSCRVVVSLALALLSICPAPASARPAASRPTRLQPQEAPQPAASDEAAKKEALEKFGGLPMVFEQNRGQTDARVEYLARGRGYALFLTPDSAVLSLSAQVSAGEDAVASKLGTQGAFTPANVRRAAIRMNFAGADPAARVVGQESLESKSNYLIGSDPSLWHTDVPNYAKVRYEGLYPGVDLVYYGTDGQMEYDFVVAPGASVDAIQMRVEGADRVSVDDEGDLLLEVAGQTIRQRRPVLYQEDSAGRRPVAGGYATDGESVWFDVGGYDASRPLVIDPVLLYSTFLGGTAGVGRPGDVAQAVAVFSQFAVVAGFTNSSDFPTTSGGYSRVTGGGYDAFVAKMSVDGSTLVYSTYLGGQEYDQASGVAVDASGAAYVTGATSSVNFPTTAAAYDTTFNGSGAGGQGDIFVAKVSASGSGLDFSTFIGGANDESGAGIAVDATGAAYVAGSTEGADYPVTGGAYDTTLNGGSDVVVTKLNATGSGLIYSTFVGGANGDYGYAIAVDPSTAAYVTGYTGSMDYPFTAGALDTTFNATSFSTDAFVTKVNAAGSGLAYSTYLGGEGDDSGSGIAVDASGAVFVTGSTTGSFPTTAGAADTSFNGGRDAFVTKVNAAGSGLAYSTYLGGALDEEPSGIAVDASGAVYVTGETESTDFSTTAGANDTTYNGGMDVYVTKLNALGTARTYSTYIGGSGDEQGAGLAVDTSGAAYVVGSTFSSFTSDFPTTPGAYDTSYNGATDAFVLKLNAAGSGRVYASFLGGISVQSDDRSGGIAVDVSGAAYVVGSTSSVDFPTTNGTYDAIENGDVDLSVTKLNAAGTGLVYSTYVGGVDGEFPGGIAVDASGAVYVTGVTRSGDYPTTAGALDTSYSNGQGDAFVTKLNASGTGLGYSTYLGADDSGEDIAVDASGSAYVIGETGGSLPTTAGAYDTSYNGSGDAFVAKLNAAGSTLAYATYLGGMDTEVGLGVAVDASGAAYVTGYTRSTDFPAVGAFDTTYNGRDDVFVVKVNTTGTGLVYSTFLGGTDEDFGNDVAVDVSGAAYVTGYSGPPDIPFKAAGRADDVARPASANFPTTAGAYDTTANGGNDIFVTKLNADGAGLAYSTYVGGLNDEEGLGVAVDASGAACVVGRTASSNYPTMPGAYDASFNGGSTDVVLTKLSAAGNSLTHSTLFGGPGDEQAEGVALSSFGGVYIAGTTMSATFPITAGAFDSGFSGTSDEFVLFYCVGDQAPPDITAQPLDRTINRGQTATLAVTAAATNSLSLSYQWYRGESGFTGDPVASATSATLVTPPLQSTTKFWCRVSDACGAFRDSASATVTVLRAPVPVTTNSDSGAGSLRAAIAAANADPGTDTITFNLGAPYTVSLASALPQITEALVVDGLSQAGASAGHPLVVLAGPGAGAGQASCADDAAASFDGLHFASTAAGSVVRGLVINGMPGDGIEFQGGGDAGHQSTVQSCFIGTNAAGSAAVINGRHGIYCNNAAYTVLGGDRAPDRSLALGNLVSGNHCSGIEIKGGLAANNVVVGSNVGPDVSGTFAVGNGIGIEIDGAPNTVVGAAGDDASKRNVCGFNMGAGTNTTGNINTKLGGTAPPNTVVLGTTFTGNGGGAIVGGANYTVGLTSATLAGTTLSVTGTATVPANRQYRVQYFSNTTCSAMGGQGEVLIAGDVLKQSTSGGVLDLDFSSAATTVRPGELIAVTVTGTEGTSNFSSCQIVSGRLGVVAERTGQVPFTSLPVSGGAGPVEQGTPGGGTGGTPGLDRTFAGPRDPDDPDVASDEITPPDPQAAVGPNHLVAVTNSEIVVASKTDGAVSRRVPLDAMWAGLVRTPAENLLAFNPRATYDTLAGHFVVVATANPSAANSAVLLAVSKTSDALGQWNVYRYDAEGADVLWADYPTLGFTKDWIAVQVNMSSIAFANVIVRSEIYLVDKAAAYAGSPGTGKATVLGRATNDASFGATQMPAMTYDAAASTLWLAQTGAGNSGGVGAVQLYKVTGAVGSETLSAGPAFTTPNTWFTNQLPYPNLAPQQGAAAKLQINDTRMQAVVFRNNHLYFAHTILLPAVSPTRSAVQWWEVDPSGAGTLVQRGRVDSGAATDMTAHPSLAVSATGAMVLGYSRFSTTSFPSSAYRFRTAGDAAGTLRGEVILKAGEASYTKTLGGSDNRWGDYSSATVDPSDTERFWLLGEYAETPRTGTATTDQWGVWWGSTAGSGACTVGCPSNIVTQTGVGAGSCGKAVTYPAPTVTGGACGTVTCAPASGSTFAVGVTTVTCSDGASHSCSFTITVQDNTVPSITCPAPQTIAAGANCQAAAPDLRGLATAGDNCAGVVVTQSPAPGTLLGLGPTQVTLTATDASGNTAMCQTTVTVADQTGPQISCPSAIQKDAAPNACTARVDMQFSVSDNCPGAITVVTSPPSGSSFAVGTTTVTITATDLAGNVSTCQTTVNVRDVTAPLMGACPTNIQTVALVPAGRAVTYTAPTATDACAGVTVSCTPASGSTFAVGTTTVTCTATDASSNQSSCGFTVTVAAIGTDTAGYYQPAFGQWSLRNTNTTGSPEIQFYYGEINTPFVKLDGDWDGDGDDTPGLYDPGTGAFFITNQSTGGVADAIFYFGAGGDLSGLKPVVGDWDGDGKDTVGLYVVSTGVFFLTNRLENGAADIVLYFGIGGQQVNAVTGDWDGDGDDTVGLYNTQTGVYFLRNSNTSGNADFSFQFGGVTGEVPVVGDWNGDGTDTIGVYRPATNGWFLKNTNASGNADVSFTYGPTNGFSVLPLAGDWDGH